MKLTTYDFDFFESKKSDKINYDKTIQAYWKYKAGLFIIGITLIISLLTYTKNLIDGLRSDNREIVQLYAEIIAMLCRMKMIYNLDFIFDNIIKKVKSYYSD